MPKFTGHSDDDAGTPEKRVAKSRSRKPSDTPQSKDKKQEQVESKEVFGPHEAEEFLRREGFPPLAKGTYSRQVCATLMNVSKRITDLSAEIKTLKSERDKLQASLGIVKEELRNANGIIIKQTELLDSDMLTGVSNLRALTNEIERVAARRRPNGRRKSHENFPSAAAVMFDLDKFKSINTEFGYRGGDAALRHVAQLVKKNLRKGDMVGRVGGDEFMAVMYDVKPGQANTIGEQLEKDVLDNPLIMEDMEGVSRRVPLSITTAAMPITHTDSIETLKVSLGNEVLRKKAGGQGAAGGIKLGGDTGHIR